MKRMDFLRIAMLCLLVAAGLTSCKREPLIEDVQDSTHTLQGVTSNHPKFKNKAQGSGCAEGYTGGLWMITNSTRNSLSWTVGSQGPSNYNFYGVPVTYALYKFTASASGWDTYLKMHVFSSLSTNMGYGGSLTNLPNGTKFVLFVDEDASINYPPYLYRQSSDTYCSYYISIGGDIYVDDSVTDRWCFSTGNGYGNVCPVK